MLLIFPGLDLGVVCRFICHFSTLFEEILVFSLHMKKSKTSYHSFKQFWTLVFVDLLGIGNPWTSALLNQCLTTYTQETLNH